MAQKCIPYAAYLGINYESLYTEVNVFDVKIPIFGTENSFWSTET